MCMDPLPLCHPTVWQVPLPQGCVARASDGLLAMGSGTSGRAVAAPVHVPLEFNHPARLHSMRYPSHASPGGLCHMVAAGLRPNYGNYERPAFIVARRPNGDLS